MEYEDRRTIATPEGVELELPLAGLGSRFIGLLIDSVIQGVVIVIAVIALVSAGGAVAAAVIASAAALLVLGYDVLVEVRGGGRTLGKRAAGVRVVMDGGRPVDLRASLIRNVIRLFEGFATSYLPATISILATRGNQRLGDLAAGTLVIREPKRAAEAPPARAVAAPVSWDVTGIRDEETAVVRAFLDRREALAPHARRSLAADLAGKLRPRVAGARAGLGDEEFLEQLTAAKAKR